MVGVSSLIGTEGAPRGAPSREAEMLLLERLATTRKLSFAAGAERFRSILGTNQLKRKQRRIQAEMQVNGIHSENPIAREGRGISSDAEDNTLLSIMASSEGASPGCYRRHEFQPTWRERGRPGNRKWNFRFRTSPKKQERFDLFSGVGSAHSTSRLGKPITRGRGRQTNHIDKRNMARTQWRWVGFLLRKETT